MDQNTCPDVGSPQEQKLGKETKETGVGELDERAQDSEGEGLMRVRQTELVEVVEALRDLVGC